MWFVGPGRTRGAAHADRVAAQLRRFETEADEHDANLPPLERTHNELDERVRELEAELERLRHARLEAYAEWWHTREDRDRARHIARRLRRRLDRVQCRLLNLYPEP